MSSSDHSATATRLRVLIGAMNREIAETPPSDAVRAAWTAVVAALALGTAAEMRECPRCKGVGMRTASRCGVCWTALPTLPPLPAEVSP
jgi:hypothetical protein